MRLSSAPAADESSSQDPGGEAVVWESMNLGSCLRPSMMAQVVESLSGSLKRNRWIW